MVTEKFEKTNRAVVVQIRVQITCLMSFFSAGEKVVNPAPALRILFDHDGLNTL